MPVHQDGYLIPFTSAEITAMNIRTFDIRYGAHPIITREVDQNTVVRKYLVDWDSREDFCELVIGRSVLWVDGATTKLSRLLPDDFYGRYPPSLSPGQIVATKILDLRGHAAGIDNIAGEPAYTDAEVTVFYEQATYLLRDDATAANDERNRFLSLGPNIPVESEAIGPIAHGIYKYVRSDASAPDGHGDAVPFGVMRQRAVEKFSLFWHDVPWDVYSSAGPLWNRIHKGNVTGGVTTLAGGYLGTVNNLTLDITGIGAWLPETILFDRAEPILERGPLPGTDFEGLRLKIRFDFLFCRQGWLDLLHPVHGTFMQVANDGAHHALGGMPDDVGLYRLRDLNLLFDVNNV